MNTTIWPVFRGPAIKVNLNAKEFTHYICHLTSKFHVTARLIISGLYHEWKSLLFLIYKEATHGAIAIK